MTVKAFVGFQIHSAYHTVQDIESLFEKLRKRPLKDAIRLSVRSDLQPAPSLAKAKLRSEIQDVHIALFDVSENNANVMIEVGLADGSHKQVFLLKKSEVEEAIPNAIRPSRGVRALRLLQLSMLSSSFDMGYSYTSCGKESPADYYVSDCGG